MGKLKFHPKAFAELNSATIYLNRESPGLGEIFLTDFEKSLRLLQAFPETWPFVIRNIRRLSVPRFHYSIFYRFLDDGIIEVLAVTHAKRKPFNFLDRT